MKIKLKNLLKISHSHRPVRFVRLNKRNKQTNEQTPTFASLLRRRNEARPRHALRRFRFRFREDPAAQKSFHFPVFEKSHCRFTGFLVCASVRDLDGWMDGATVRRATTTQRGATTDGRTLSRNHRRCSDDAGWYYSIVHVGVGDSGFIHSRDSLVN